MTIDEILLNVKAASFADMVCVKDVWTEEDKAELMEKGYMPGLTEAEFTKLFPNVDPGNIYYLPCLSMSAFYFNKKTLAVCPFHVEFYAGGITEDDGSFLRAIQSREKNVAEGKFMGSIVTLPDAMRMEYFKLLVEKYDDVPDLYRLFFDVYVTADYGFERVAPEVIEAVLRSKTDEDRKKTEKQLRVLPDTFPVYRGGNVDKSTPAHKALSWTTDENVANFFACRRGSTEGYITVGKACKTDVIDAFLDNREKEIVIDPKNVQITEVRKLEGISFCEKVLPDVTPIYHDYLDLLDDIVFARESEEHGKLHSARVLLLCLTLGHMLELPESDMRTLATAAIYHDSQRTNDGDDQLHGAAARKVYENEKGTRTDATAAFLMEYHCRPDEEGLAAIQASRALSKRRSRTELLYSVFKDADAMDRVRFGIGALDVRMLRLPESKTLPLVARLFNEQIKL